MVDAWFLRVGERLTAALVNAFLCHLDDREIESVEANQLPGDSHLSMHQSHFDFACLKDPTAQPWHRIPE